MNATKTYWFESDYKLDKVWACLHDCDTIQVTDGNWEPAKPVKHMSLKLMFNEMKKRLEASTVKAHPAIIVPVAAFAIMKFIARAIKYPAKNKRKTADYAEPVLWKGKATDSNIAALYKKQFLLSTGGANVSLLKKGRKVLYYMPHEPWSYAKPTKEQEAKLRKSFNLQPIKTYASIEGKFLVK